MKEMTPARMRKILKALRIRMYSDLFEDMGPACSANLLRSGQMEWHMQINPVRGRRGIAIFKELMEAGFVDDFKGYTGCNYCDDGIQLHEGCHSIHGVPTPCSQASGGSEHG
jgi:hypothetical protein